MNKLSVYLRSHCVGTLESDGKGRLQFTYKKNAAEALSLSLPLHEMVFDHKASCGYFYGLFSQDENLNAYICKLLDIPSKDPLPLFQQLGVDCLGAVSFGSSNDAQQSQIQPEPSKVLNDTEWERLLKSYTFRSAIEPKSALRLLPGKSAKLSVCVENGNVALPGAHAISTHLLVPGVGHEELLLNEFFCMNLAKNLGYSVVDCELKRFGGTAALLIQRYDREPQHQQVHVFHQENFKQALGIKPHHKSEILSLKECFKLINKTQVPAIERNRLMKWLMFNYLIGNSGITANHLSLVYKYPRLARLAPFYGLMSGLVAYESDEIAFKIGENNRLMEISGKDWKALCKEVGFSYPAFKREFLETIEAAIAQAQKLKMELAVGENESVVFEKICRVIEQQGERAYKTLLR